MSHSLVLECICNYLEFPKNIRLLYNISLVSRFYYDMLKKYFDQFDIDENNFEIFNSNISQFYLYKLYMTNNEEDFKEVITNIMKYYMVDNLDKVLTILTHPMKDKIIDHILLNHDIKDIQYKLKQDIDTEINEDINNESIFLFKQFINIIFPMTYLNHLVKIPGLEFLRNVINPQLGKIYNINQISLISSDLSIESINESTVDKNLL